MRRDAIHICEAIFASLNKLAKRLACGGDGGTHDHNPEAALPVVVWSWCMMFTEERYYNVPSRVRPSCSGHRGPM